MNARFLRRLSLASALLLAGTSAHASQSAEAFSFGVFGDTPYNGFEERHFPALLAEMNAEPLRFVAHDGDFKSGGERCDDSLFEQRLRSFNSSHHPFIYVPGDNDWTDCHRSSNGGYAPLERLAKLRQVFFAEPRRSLGQNSMAVESQADDPTYAAWPEHQRWQIGPVLFISLNVPGGGNNIGKKKDQPSEEYRLRSAALRAWIADGFRRAREAKVEGVVLILQANPDLEDFSQGHPNRAYRDLLTQLVDETREFAGQVLLIHGDTHWQRSDQPLNDPASGQRLENFTRVETFGSPFMGWVKISVEPGSRKLFRIEPRPYTPAREN